MSSRSALEEGEKHIAGAKIGNPKHEIQNNIAT
jgi:hypothetical protein